MYTPTRKNIPATARFMCSTAVLLMTRFISRPQEFDDFRRSLRVSHMAKGGHSSRCDPPQSRLPFTTGICLCPEILGGHGFSRADRNTNLDHAPIRRNYRSRPEAAVM